MISPRPLRICLDINVWVSAALATQNGRTRSAALAMKNWIVTGKLLGRPVQLVMGVEMIDTLTEVLLRVGIPSRPAAAFGARLIELMKSGPEALDPLLLLSGRDQIAMHDREDAGVLATAIAARVDLLVTDNLTDFVTNDSVSFNTRVVKPAAGERQLLTILHEQQDGVALVVAHPLDVREWVRGGFLISADSVRLVYGGKNTGRISDATGRTSAK